MVKNNFLVPSYELNDWFEFCKRSEVRIPPTSTVFFLVQTTVNNQKWLNYFIKSLKWWKIIFFSVPSYELNDCLLQDWSRSGHMPCASMFSRFKGSGSSQTLLESNAITSYFEVGRQTASAGPGFLWKIHDAYRKSDGKVNTWTTWSIQPKYRPE